MRFTPHPQYSHSNAHAPARVFSSPDIPDAALAEPLEIARTQTTSNASFELSIHDDSAGAHSWLVTNHSSETNIQHGERFSHCIQATEKSGQCRFSRGVPLALNAMVGLSADQLFTVTIDTAFNPGVSFSGLYDVQMVMEYEAQI